MNLRVSKFCCRAAALALLLVLIPSLHAQERWTEAQANAWYAQQPWPVGANFLPSTSINELEMWQAESFDTATIDRELGWAEAIGMNTMRVFLHTWSGNKTPKASKAASTNSSKSPRATTSARS